MKKAKWNLFLLKRHEQPLLYFAECSEEEILSYLNQCASKVFDGSDADAFLLTRSDNYGSTLTALARGVKL